MERRGLVGWHQALITSLAKHRHIWLVMLVPSHHAAELFSLGQTNQLPVGLVADRALSSAVANACQWQVMETHCWKGLGSVSVLLFQMFTFFPPWKHSVSSSAGKDLEHADNCTRLSGHESIFPRRSHGDDPIHQFSPASPSELFNLLHRQERFMRTNACNSSFKSSLWEGRCGAMVSWTAAELPSALMGRGKAASGGEVHSLGRKVKVKGEEDIHLLPGVS